MMNFEQLMILSEKNEVRIDNFRGYKSSIPYYYDSLRHAFGFYFNTFITNNSSYAFYAEGLYKRNVSFFKHQVLDQDNTVLTIIAFERFFELLIKQLLGRVNKKLTLMSNQRLNGIQDLIIKIQNNNFSPRRFSGKVLSIPFRETIDRFYNLIDYSKANANSGNIVKKFSKLINEYSFLDSPEYKATFQYLNWYRDRILHNGNKLPSLWLLDFIISQRIVPIVAALVRIDNKKIEGDFFYFKTVTGIDILYELNKIKLEFKELKSKKKQNDSFTKLLKIGHLKELGRANMNMNLFVRQNKATYEYNYHDVKGRGQRFALAEKDHADNHGVSECPCCGVDSLAMYKIIADDIFNPGKKVKIDWVKCYTCDYHLRYDTGEPYMLELFNKPLFK